MNDITYSCGHTIRAEPIAENPLPITVEGFCPTCYLHPVLYTCGHTMRSRFSGPTPKAEADGLIHSQDVCRDCYAGLPPSFRFTLGKKRGAEACNAHEITRLLRSRGYKLTAQRSWFKRLKSKAAYSRELAWATDKKYKVSVPPPPKKRIALPKQPKQEESAPLEIPARWLQ